MSSLFFSFLSNAALWCISRRRASAASFSLRTCSISYIYIIMYVCMFVLFACVWVIIYQLKKSYCLFTQVLIFQNNLMLNLRWGFFPFYFMFTSNLLNKLYICLFVFVCCLCLFVCCYVCICLFVFVCLCLFAFTCLRLFIY